MKLGFQPNSDDDLLIKAIEPDAFASKIGLDIVSVSTSGWSSACCPLHSEDSPSFGIDLDPQSDTYLRWRCFHESDSRGDAIELVAKIKEISRTSARELMFEWFDFDGIPAPDLDDLLKELEKRAPVKHQFRIPLPRTTNDVGPIVEYLLNDPKRKVAGYTEEDALAIINRWGLRHADGGYYADRIIIPMCDPNGRQVYFQAQATNPEFIQHLEPPRHKAKLFPQGTMPDILHGLHLIEGGTVVVVEGYFDACALDHWGIPTVMATSASLSEAQIALLVEYADRVIVWFDNDVRKGDRNTGQEAAHTACLALKDAGLEAYRVEGPADIDPDEVGGYAQARKIIRECSTVYAPNSEPGYDELEDMLDDW